MWLESILRNFAEFLQNFAQAGTDPQAGNVELLE
jgi:hypothetical protein